MQFNENNQTIPCKIAFCEITSLNKFWSTQSPPPVILSESTDSTESLQKVLFIGVHFKLRQRATKSLQTVP